jgi:hypothetical protein
MEITRQRPFSFGYDGKVSVGTQAYGKNRVGTLEDTKALPTLDVPNAQRAVTAAG